MFTRTSLRSQAGGCHHSRLGSGESIVVTVITSSSSTRLTYNPYKVLLKCDSTQDGYTSPTVLFAVVVHKLLDQFMGIQNWMLLFMICGLHAEHSWYHTYSFVTMKVLYPVNVPPGEKWSGDQSRNLFPKCVKSYLCTNSPVAMLPLEQVLSHEVVECWLH